MVIKFLLDGNTESAVLDSLTPSNIQFCNIKVFCFILREALKIFQCMWTPAPGATS